MVVASLLPPATHRQLRSTAKEGSTRLDHRAKAEAAYAFKGERPATFDTFTILIRGTESGNVQEFELLVGNDSPTGAFEPIGKFQTNRTLFKTPCQEFEFPAMTARYLKVKSIYNFYTIAGIAALGIGFVAGRSDRLNFILAVVLSLPWTLLSGYVANDVTRFSLVILTTTPIPWFDRSFLF